MDTSPSAKSKKTPAELSQAGDSPTNTSQTDLELWPIGNCQVSGLIDTRGGLVWGSVPRVDGDPVFCALLRGEEARDDQGVWRLELENQISATQRYLRNTPILVTRLEDERGGAVEIIDFCPRFESSGRMYRPVAYIRIVKVITGAPRLCVRLAPMKNYGTEAAAHTNGSNHIRYLAGGQVLRLTTNASVGYVLEQRPFRVEKTLHFFLGPDEPFLGKVGREVDSMLEQTVSYWREWVRGLATPLEWQDAVIRAAITLKLCQHEETGAIVAALTTSIPEAASSERNWDYRYCWIRDAYYTVQALNRLGALDVLEKYLSYLRNLVDDAKVGQIQPLYSVSGKRELEERIVEGLQGYRGMGPVRAGNAAYTQVQHDVYGQIILPNIQAFFDRRFLRMADVSDFEKLESVGEAAWESHSEPDAGLWELRTRSAVHTYSVVMSWAACDRLGNAAALLGLDDREAIWTERAHAIRAKIEAQAWSEEGGHYAATFGGRELDASLLQLVDLRYISAEDSRFLATLEAVEKSLRRGEHMLRYDTEDDFGQPETAFNICTFWLIEALHYADRNEEARELFETMLEHRTQSGLLSEDMDFVTGELWGNFPQTYSLVGIINCAVLLSEPWSTVR
ncbi:glycoside hydrolase family 15 protein [Denitrobaculum tricleocarpae]|uniref:Glycoside hydrolase family 15 protein n=1 Tax=Denitrobaculum tricleocarpae TaxID=2591009 RepID=A0A545TG03_9PROT|nr:glycoside hydrolase family 15 protein [Denitrobaculum tricleocarpae]TQV76111.1 glycoside hydrolase family 15 protein [Denitrobaculum tricleocarpae]